jgi:hypothetical protein
LKLHPASKKSTFLFGLFLNQGHMEQCLGPAAPFHFQLFTFLGYPDIFFDMFKSEKGFLGDDFLKPVENVVDIPDSMNYDHKSDKKHTQQ